MRTVSSIKKACDRLYSEIRRRDASLEHSKKHGSVGYASCCSCGKVEEWRDMDAGHYVCRKHNNTRFEDCNVHAQCRACNRFDEGNVTGYTQFMLERYGTEILDDLDEMKNDTRKFTKDDLLELEQEFKERLKEIKKVTV